jgi:hypothetical protein
MKKGGRRAEGRKGREGRAGRNVKDRRKEGRTDGWTEGRM